MALDDPLLEEAKDLVIKTGKASASYLQRMFRIGYARAASLLDMLEVEGIIGPADGAKPRGILMRKDKGHISGEDEEESEEEESLSDLDETVKENLGEEEKEEIEEKIEEDEEKLKESEPEEDEF